MPSRCECVRSAGNSSQHHGDHSLSHSPIACEQLNSLLSRLPRSDRPQGAGYYPAITSTLLVVQMSLHRIALSRRYWPLLHRHFHLRVTPQVSSHYYIFHRLPPSLPANVIMITLLPAARPNSGAEQRLSSHIFELLLLDLHCISEF